MFRGKEHRTLLFKEVLLIVADFRRFVKTARRYCGLTNCLGNRREWDLPPISSRRDSLRPHLIPASVTDDFQRIPFSHPVDQPPLQTLVLRPAPG